MTSGKQSDDAGQVVGLAHHITPVSLNRQKYIDDHPSYMPKDIVRPNSNSWLFLPLDPAFNVLKTISASVSLPSLPGSAAAKSATTALMSSTSKSAFSLSSIASAISEQLQPDSEKLEYVDPAAAAVGFFDTPPLRESRTADAIKPVLLDLTRRSGCHPAYDGWAILVTGSLMNAGRNILEMLIGVGDVVLYTHLSMGIPSRDESGLLDGAIPLLIPQKEDIIDLKVLGDLLGGWKGSRWGQKGVRKPKLLVHRPNGPVTDEHRTELYALLRQHDLILLEVNQDHYLSARAGRQAVAATRHPATRRMVFLEELRGHSMVEMDTEGRVIRIDSLTSATDGNCGLSWVVCNPLFHKHLKRIQEARGNVSIGVPDYVVSQAIAANWKGCDGLLDRFVTVSDELGRRAEVCMGVLAKHFRMEEILPTRPQPRYNCFSRRSLPPAALEKKAPLDGQPLPLLAVSVRTSGVYLIAMVQLESHWRLANLSRSDIEHTRVSRALSHELYLHLVSNSIYIPMGTQFQRKMSMHSHGPPTQQELEQHFLPATRPQAVYIIPNPVGYVPEDTEAVTTFPVCINARPLDEVEKSLKKLCEEVEAFFLKV